MEELSQTLGFGQNGAAEAVPPRSRPQADSAADAHDGGGRGEAASRSRAPTVHASSINQIVLPLLLTLPMLVLVWTIAARPPSAHAPAPSAATPERSIYRTSAAQLYRDYSTNEAATQARIGQKRILVTGTITAVSQDFLGDNEVLLDVGSAVSAAEMALRPDQNQLAVLLQKGQSVTLLCDQMQRLTDAPEGSGCRLLAPHGNHANFAAGYAAQDHPLAVR